MTKCNNCQYELEPDAQFCPSCGQPCKPEVIEAELVDDSRPRKAYSWSDSQDQDAQGGHRQFVYTNFSGPISGSTGCMPVIITLVLAMIAAFTYGFLAGLGFLFFSAIGLGVTFYLTIKRIFDGKRPNLLVSGLVTWGLSWLLVAWMSGAFT